MLRFTVAMFCIIGTSTIVFSQQLEIHQRTSGANSPAIFASSVSIAYGIRPSIVLELDSLFARQGLSLAQRRAKAVSLVSKFRALQGNPQTSTVSETAIRQAFGKETQPSVLQLFTEAANSPAIYAKGDVSVTYGIGEEAFWGLYSILERKQVSVESWESSFKEQVERFRTLGKGLDVRYKYDPIAAQAKEKLDQGDIPGAERILTADVFGLNKQTAYRNYEAALVRELNLKYTDTTTTLFRNATLLDANSPEYRLAYANNLRMIAQYHEAIRQYEQSIQLTEPSDSSGISVCYNNLGLTHAYNGEHDQAINYYEKALAIGLKIYGESHPEVAVINNNLGGAYVEKAEYDLAISYCEKALAIDLKIYGESYPQIANDYNNLGSAYANKGEYDRAISYFEKALAINLKIYEENHPEVAIYYNNLGSAYANKGEYDRAISYYKKALAIDLKIYGESHPHVATIYNNLGGTYDSKGEYDLAISYYKKALSIDLKIFGESHPTVAGCYSNLGLVYIKKGEYDRAISYYEKALAIDLKIYGEDHPDVATIYNNLGGTYDSKGEYDLAISYYKKALFINLKIFGESHLDVAVCYNNLGSTYDSNREYDRAINYYEKALTILYHVFPDGHPKLTTTHQNISFSYNNRGMDNYRAGQYRQALPFFEKGLNASRSAGDTSFIITCLNNLGSSLKHLNQCDSALLHLDRGIATAEQLEQELMKQVNLLPDSILQSPEFPARLAQYSHKAVLQRLYFHKAGCLHRLGRKREARQIFDRLKQEAIETKNEGFLKEIEKEGY